MISVAEGIDRRKAQPVLPGGFAHASTKRVFDLVISLVMFVLTVPLMLIIMAMVKLTSRGPAIYTQERLGKDGRIFTIYKIRTMVQNSEQLTGPTWCVPSDPRVTSIGRLLRCTHLDELPQLWNILRGDLSLVGPRPERPSIAAKLERSIPNYRDRLAVRPGLTGLAQVQQPPDTNESSVRRKLSHDLRYIEEADLWLDLRILVSTTFHILGFPGWLIAEIFRFPRPAPVEVVEGDGAARVQVNPQPRRRYAN